MKILSLHKERQHGGLIRSLLTLLTLIALLNSSRAATLLSCGGLSGGDHHYRGFYIPSYPGNSLDSARMVFSAPDAGNYTVRLTARKGAYDGAIIGSSATTFNLAGAYPQDKAVTFTFPSVRITEGTRVCFLLSIVSGPGTTLYYSVADWSGGCAAVVETEGTTPPLDTFRRNGVNLVINGEDTLIVAPGESIQAAIDAASVGDTVYVDPGTYTENIRLRDSVNVVGAGYTATTLRGLGNSNVVAAVNVTDARMEGFRITRSGTNQHAGVNIFGGNVQINNNWIIGNLQGVRITGNSSAIIRNNIIQGNGLTAGVLDYGIVCVSSTPLIANNVVVSNHGVGLYIAGPASTGAQVINNTVVDNDDDGVWCYNGANVTLKNNIFKGNSRGISASHGAAPLLSFNNVYGNDSLNYNPYSGGSVAPGPGDISADPLFNTLSSPPFALIVGSPCINAGDPNPIHNDLDGTRNDIGAFGGPSGLNGGVGSALGSGFLFNNIGKIPTSEITRTGPSTGLANVSAPVASALSIYRYKDAPFGGDLWLHGLFGTTDNSVYYYRIYAAPWTGISPPAPASFVPISDPLSKVKYTIGPGGVVTASLENIGPDSSGMYLRTESGYWAHPDLKMIWNTRQMANGRYDLICKAYNVFRVEVPLPPNTLSRITVHVNNQPVTATINQVRNHLGIEIPECGIVPLASDTQNLQFDITASHPGGFLRDWSLDVLYGRNRYGGGVASDRYAGVNDTMPPTWAGVTAVVSNSAPAHAAGTLLPWTSCAYQFRLTAWARTTDGFGHLYYQSFSDHYSLNVGSLTPSACVADLDADGDVDGADLAIFVTQFGQTNCVSLVSP